MCMSQNSRCQHGFLLSLSSDRATSPTIWNLRGNPAFSQVPSHRSLTLSSHSLGHSTRRVWHTSCREAPAAHQSTIARRYKYLNALPPSRHRDRVGCLRRLHLQRRPPDDWLRLRAPPAPRAARYPPIRTMGKVRQLPLTPPRRRTARSSPQQRGAGEAEQNDESPPQSPIQAHPRRTARSHWHGTVCC